MVSSVNFRLERDQPFNFRHSQKLDEDIEQFKAGVLKSSFFMLEYINFCFQKVMDKLNYYQLTNCVITNHALVYCNQIYRYIFIVVSFGLHHAQYTK